MHRVMLPLAQVTTTIPGPADAQLSVLDLFKIGIGPSSSHTVGPMRCGQHAAHILQALPDVARVIITLCGSLAATGKGHYTDAAVVLGLSGHAPATVPAHLVDHWISPEAMDEATTLEVLGHGEIAFNAKTDVIWQPALQSPHHVNAMTIQAMDSHGMMVADETYFSIGGGFVQRLVEGSLTTPSPTVVDLPNTPYTPGALSLPDATVGLGDGPAVGACPYPFTTAERLLAHCDATGHSIATITYMNETSQRTPEEVDAYIDGMVEAMFACIDAGCATQGVLPGRLQVRRRAKALYDQLVARADVLGDGEDIASDEAAGQDQAAGVAGIAKPANVRWAGTKSDPLRAMDWVNVYALAVNEENAAGHTVVTAPTNGAAGVVPAVLGYLVNHCPEGRGPKSTQAIRDFILAATAIGSIIKTNASIAGAEVGCQGEVGSASSMAAAGLAQAWGGTPRQVENAAEIAMEHNLGLTCDPVGGLVQIPCIERNALAAVKAINAARMAMWGDGRHTVSLDVVIETMYQTGMDMMSKYKETSVGGLAVNVVEC